MHELKIKNLFTEKAIYEDILCIQTKGQKMLQKNVFPYKSQLRRKYVNHHCRSAVEFSYSYFLGMHRQNKRYFSSWHYERPAGD